MNKKRIISLVIIALLIIAGGFMIASATKNKLDGEWVARYGNKEISLDITMNIDLKKERIMLNVTEVPPPFIVDSYNGLSYSEVYKIKEVSDSEVTGRVVMPGNTYHHIVIRYKGEHPDKGQDYVTVNRKEVTFKDGTKFTLKNLYRSEN